MFLYCLGVDGKIESFLTADALGQPVGMLTGGSSTAWPGPLSFEVDKKEREISRLRIWVCLPASSCVGFTPFRRAM